MERISRTRRNLNRAPGGPESVTGTPAPGAWESVTGTTAPGVPESVTGSTAPGAWESVAGSTAPGAWESIAGSTAAGRIREAASRGTLSHALLLTGGTEMLARYAAAAWECQSGTVKPCGRCEACRKVSREIHPDVVTVRDESHKQISADMIRSVRADAWIMPNEGTRKVYIFPECGLLTEQDQNLLLKVVEEGPAYAAFVFCAPEGSSILPTLRSRCVEIRVEAVRESSPEAEEEALELCRKLLRGRGTVSAYAVELERKRIDREKLTAILDGCYEASALALVLQYGGAADHRESAYTTAAEGLCTRLNRRQNAMAVQIFRKYREECTWQVGVNHVLGALAAELEKIL